MKARICILVTVRDVATRKPSALLRVTRHVASFAFVESEAFTKAGVPRGKYRKFTTDQERLHPLAPPADVKFAPRIQSEVVRVSGS